MTTETIPEQGAEIELDGYRYILELVSDTKIETIRVQKLEIVNEKMADWHIFFFSGTTGHTPCSK